MLYFVEFLTLRVWLFSVLPEILRNRRSKRPLGACQFIDATRPGIFAASACTFLLPGLSVSRLSFRLIDVRDEAGLLSRLTIPYLDLQEVQNDAASEPEFCSFAESAGIDRLRSYALKSLVTASLTDRQTLWRVMFVIRVCAWSMRKQKSSDAVVFLESRAWFSSIRRYAQKNGIRAISVTPSLNWRKLPFRLMPPRCMWMLRALRDRVFHLRFGVAGLSQPKADGNPGQAKLATDYWGYFNLKKPECYSDLFFWQKSQLPGRSILLTLSLPADPIDEQRASELSVLGIRAVALNSQSSATPTIPLFTYLPSLTSSHIVTRTPGRPRERKWIDRQKAEYWMVRDYWTELFRRENVRVFTSWYRYDGTHCAIGDAIRSVGGIMTIYQRACQPDAGPEVAIDTDVAFAYAPFDAEVERRSQSTIRYHVSVGYFGDHRFPLLRKPAAEVRSRLASHGARFVIAFFDENSNPDARWNTGQRFQAENYEFLLEKLLADPTLGLVFKPKMPSTLRRRLGPVSLLLEKALSTGRCFLYEEGTVQGSHPPAGAAMAADIAIHGHLCAATAGLEAALAGTPTLLLDREGWQISDMYQLGEGSVVFQSWPQLWSAVNEHRNHASIPGFGDWSPMLDTFDPFRDGRGAERLGTYLSWLLDGLNNGRDRDSVMAEAAERYSARWGADKVVEIGGFAKMYDRPKEMTSEP